MSLTQNELNALQNDCNLPLIFTKLATKIESQEMWVSIVLVEIRNVSIRQTGSGIKSPLLLWRNIFKVKYIENGGRYDVRLKGGQIGNHPSTFDWHHDF